MISVAEAKNIIRGNTNSLIPAKLPLTESVGLMLADDVFAVSPVPPFPQSAMDGYAFSFKQWQLNKRLKIAGEVAAGSKEALTIGSGMAARIFTGAVVPSGADTVVMQEKVSVENGELIIHDENISAGANVRIKGAEIESGALALEKGSILSPAAIGLLTGAGVTEVNVYPEPSITIIVTGNELQQPGKPLQYGQVYESGSITLATALQQLHFTRVTIVYAEDDPVIITAKLQMALEQSDLVLLTGGVSVGDYDFTVQATESCGVQKLFHKIKQRPGKPLYFGKKGSKVIFGLPGNPASVLTCFYQYVIPALESLSRRNIALSMIKVPLAKSFQKAAGLTHFLKGWYDGTTVMLLGAQESFRLSSFAKANCLVQIDEDVTVCEQGEPVDVYLLPR
jgi:molybdopterin molybdotransferase